MPSVAAVFSLCRPKCSSVARVSWRSTSASGVPTRIVSVGGAGARGRGPRARRAGTRRRWSSPAPSRRRGGRRCAARARCRASGARPGAAAPPARSASPRLRARRSAARKCWASSGTSSARSRSGGRWIGNTFRRYSRSSRSLPSATACVGLRLVAAITRTSVSWTWVEPTRMNVPVSSTRSSFTCSSSGISVISSRNSVPPLARSKKPLCWRSAPVKLPFSWPKISLSIRFGEIAPQLTARNGLAAAPAQVVHGAGDELLAGAALAGDEDRHGGAGDARDLLVDAPHRRRTAPQSAEVAFASPASASGRRQLPGAPTACVTRDSTPCSCFRFIGLTR